MIVCERSGSYSVRIEACANRSVAPRLAGMIGVAFDLGRPALVALDEQPGRDAAERHRGGEEQRLAGDDLFGLPDVGNDQLVRLARAGRGAGQRHRRAHQLQEAAAADRVEPLGRLARELAVQELLELGRLGQLVEAPPVPACRRLLQPGADCLQIDRRPRYRASESSARCFIGGTSSSTSALRCRRSCIPSPARGPSSD